MKTILLNISKCLTSFVSRNRSKHAVAASITLALLACSAALAQSPRLYENFESGSLSDFNLLGNKTTKVIKLSNGNHVAMFSVTANVDQLPFSLISAKNGRGTLNVNTPYEVSFRTNLVSLPSTPGESDSVFIITPRPAGGGLPGQ